MGKSGECWEWEVSINNISISVQSYQSLGDNSVHILILQMKNKSPFKEVRLVRILLAHIPAKY